MISAKDALKLASTKLRTRRIRLGVTLFVMSLLFAALSFLAFFIDGAIGSMSSFSKEGYGNSIYVNATPMTYNEYENPTLVDALKPINASQIAQKKQLAKKFELPYDEKTDMSLPLQSQQMGPGPNDTQLVANISSPLAQEMLKQQNSELPGVSYADFTTLAKANGATKTYRGTSPYANYIGNSGGLVVLKDGKETYSSQNKQEQFNYAPPSGISGLNQTGVAQMDTGLLKPFLLKGQSFGVAKNGSIPLVAPYSAAEEMLGLKKLAATATAEAKLARLAAVREKIVGTPVQLCYRSTASQDMLRRAIEQHDDIAANKGKKDYELPKLLYKLPDTPCGATSIVSDKRTAEEKKQEQNQKAIEAISQPATTAVQGVLNMHIVGLASEPNYSTSFGISEILTNIFSSYAAFSWAVPAEAVVENTLAAEALKGTLASKSPSLTSYYAEFASLERAKQFIDKNDCFKDFNDFSTINSPGATTERCLSTNKPFMLVPYGNNAAAIEEMRRGVWKFGRYVLLVILVIASVVMMGTLGKIIADSRRETAVFRALGAKRIDISQIYLTYALLISGLIAAVSLSLGAIAASYVSGRYGPQLSVNAVLAYNASDIHKQFTLFGVNPQYILAIVGLIVVSALLSAAVPLLLNVRRNPIRDMRDES
jgi:hypothetical protein